MPGLVDEYDLTTWPGIWIVAACNSQHWQKATRDIQNNGGLVYTPIAQMRYKKGDGHRWIDRPVFPGYLFVKLPDYDFDPVRTVHDVLYLLDVNNQSQLTRELRNFQIAEANGLRVDVFRSMVPGVRVEITTGPFRGVQGVVDSKDANGRFYLTCSILGRDVPVEIDGAKLEPID